MPIRNFKLANIRELLIAIKQSFNWPDNILLKTQLEQLMKVKDLATLTIANHWNHSLSSDGIYSSAKIPLFN